MLAAPRDVARLGVAMPEALVSMVREAADYVGGRADERAGRRRRERRGDPRRARCPSSRAAEFRELVVEACRGQRRVSALFARRADGGTAPIPSSSTRCSPTRTRRLSSSRGPAIEGDAFESLTPDVSAGAPLRARDRRAVRRACPRAIPWLKPVRFHASVPPAATPGPTAGAPDASGVMDFYRVEGDEVHEVAVGPGARRRHRARALPLPVPRREGLPPRDLARLPAPRRRARARRRARRRGPLHYMETLAGDTTIGHAHRLLPRRRGPRRVHASRAGPGHPRHRARARAAREPRRRSRRARRRRRLSCPRPRSAGASAATSST